LLKSFCSNYIIMKRETGILVASSLGLLVGLGVYGFKLFLNKKDTDYKAYYGDYHRHFDDGSYDDHHGVELYAMQ